MPKFRVGIDFTVSGLVYVKQEAETADQAAGIVERNAKELAARAIETGNGDWEAEVVDVIPDRSDT